MVRQAHHERGFPATNGGVFPATNDLHALRSSFLRSEMLRSGHVLCGHIGTCRRAGAGTWFDKLSTNGSFPSSSTSYSHQEREFLLPRTETGTLITDGNVWARQDEIHALRSSFLRSEMLRSVHM